MNILAKLIRKNGRVVPRTEADRLPAFHHSTVIRDLGDGDAIRISDILTGVFVAGTTGSGKSSGPGRFLAYGLLANQCGGIVCCSKKEERIQWEAWARETNRLDDLIIVNAEGKYRFNFMEWAANGAEGTGGFTINTVALLDNVGRAISGGSGKSGGDQKFWDEALSNLNTNAVDLARLAGVVVSLPLLRSIVSSAALNLEQVNDPQWNETSACAQALRDANEATLNGDPEIRADFEECHTYWTKDFPALSDKTRSAIVLGFTMLIRPLVTSPLRKLFSSNTNVTPEDAFDGKIFIIDLPVQEFQLVGRIANLIWKHCMQTAILKRMKPADGFLRPVFIWCDECQQFVTDFDASYQAVARSAGGSTIYLTQNRESLRRVLGNDDTVDSLLANLQCMFFCANTGATNEWAAKLLGESWVKVTATNAGHSRNELNFSQPEQSSRNSGINRSEQRRFLVEPSVFTTLKRGGPQNNYVVEAIIYESGHGFNHGGESLPFKRLSFNQK